MYHHAALARALQHCARRLAWHRLAQRSASTGWHGWHERSEAQSLHEPELACKVTASTGEHGLAWKVTASTSWHGWHS